MKCYLFIIWTIVYFSGLPASRTHTSPLYKPVVIHTDRDPFSPSIRSAPGKPLACGKLQARDGNGTEAQEGSGEATDYEHQEGSGDEKKKEEISLGPLAVSSKPDQFSDKR